MVLWWRQGHAGAAYCRHTAQRRASVACRAVEAPAIDKGSLNALHDGDKEQLQRGDLSHMEIVKLVDTKLSTSAPL